MSYNEILEKAIQKAIDGGWSTWGGKSVEINYQPIVNTLTLSLDEPDVIWSVSPSSIVFNHDFAKALWGTKANSRPFLVDTHLYEGCSHPSTKTQKNYEYHLQQMVVADDPIKYLGENI